MLSVKYITVPQHVAGLDHIFGGWLLRLPHAPAPGGEFVALIDTGTGTVANEFVTALQNEGISHIDLVLLSHIHLDHCGGLNAVLKAFPTAKAVCHASAVRHLVNPGRLWSSTKEVMRELADMYGEPEPVAPEKIIAFSPEELSPLPAEGFDYPLPLIEVMSTPGHAPHSLLFAVGGYYFVGEAACCTFEHEGRVYLRPTTPPRLELPVFINSQQKILALPERPAFAGHSSAAYPSRWLVQQAQDQLLRWQEILSPLLKPLPQEDDENQIERMLRALREKDPAMGPRGIWACEKWDIFFEKHSVRGFKDFLERNQAKL